MQAELVKFEFSYFEHLEGSELKLILEREEQNLSMCFKVFDDETSFYVIIDLDPDCVHVRRIGGAFAWKWNYIENLCRVIGIELGLKKISVIADKDFMKHAVNKLDFVSMGNDFYEKRI